MPATPTVGYTDARAPVRFRWVAFTAAGFEAESEVRPVAIIAQDDATFEQACQFAHVAELVRPIRVFREWHEGWRWIDAITIDRAKAAE